MIPTDQTTRRLRKSSLWVPIVLILMAVTLLGLLVGIPLSTRIALEWEAARINSAFRDAGIAGQAKWVGRLFDGVVYVSVSRVNDRQLKTVASTLAAGPYNVPLHIHESQLSKSGLQHLAHCKNLSYILFHDSPIPADDLHMLRQSLPDTPIRSK